MSDGVHEFPSDAYVSPPVESAVRPFYWSIRRELWENRSVWMAPLIAAGFFFLGFIISLILLPARMDKALLATIGKQREAVTAPFSVFGMLMIVTTFVVGAFYSLDALNSERRDRSILFWKSLPVSDRTTVLAKAAIPLLVQPLIAFSLAVAMHIVTTLLSSIVLLGNTRGLSLYWTHMKFVRLPIAYLYGLTAITLWHAPIHAWFLLMSAWAKRAAVLWAILPFLAVAAVEMSLFRTSSVMSALAARVMGWFRAGFVFPKHSTAAAANPLAYLTPVRLFTTPALWLGLLFAALCIALAVRLRRNREPM
ncbi:MAG TPA: ABC transporter permease [Thermoanaerobaculia bacterium]|nr:ABC transporter permease [Thermoanaerobaculia bacterium]